MYFSTDSWSVHVISPDTDYSPVWEMALQSCVKGSYSTTALKYENENIICSWINLARSANVSFSILEKGFHCCLSHLSHIMTCQQVEHQVSVWNIEHNYYSDELMISFMCHLQFTWKCITTFSQLIAFPVKLLHFWHERYSFKGAKVVAQKHQSYQCHP